MNQNAIRQREKRNLRGIEKFQMTRCKDPVALISRQNHQEQFPTIALALKEGLHHQRKFNPLEVNPVESPERRNQLYLPHHPVLAADYTPLSNSTTQLQQRSETSTHGTTLNVNKNVVL
jgi:hypothetical protein